MVVRIAVAHLAHPPTMVSTDEAETIDTQAGSARSDSDAAEINDAEIESDWDETDSDDDSSESDSNDNDASWEEREKALPTSCQEFVDTNTAFCGFYDRNQYIVMMEQSLKGRGSFVLKNGRWVNKFRTGQN